MNISRQTFQKTERLCSTKVIGELFEKGNQFNTAYFRVLWDISTTTLPSPVQIAFSVAKRSFRLAVTRNLIKRRIREAYRKNKQELYEYLISEELQLVVILVFRKNEVPNYLTVEQAVKDVLSRLIRLLKKRDGKC